MVEVQSGDVATMRDASVGDLVDDLNRKQAQTPLSLIAFGSFAAAGLLVLFLSGSAQQSTSIIIGTIILLAALPAWAIGKWFDSYKRTSVIIYNLDATAEAAYRKVAECFDALSACHGRWHIQSGGVVRDLTTWKRNAGAAHLIKRKGVHLLYSLPKIVRSNVVPPAVTLGNRTFYFFPETMIVKHGSRFGAVGYDDLYIRYEGSNFIEDGTPPADAHVVSHTWQHPNKSGGPDRRFRNNRQLPVCRYEVMHLTSSSGVNELMEFSRVGFVQPFSAALADLPRKQTSESLDRMALLESSVASGSSNTVVPIPPVRKSRVGKFVAGTTLLIAGCAVVGAYELNSGLGASGGNDQAAQGRSTDPIPDSVRSRPLATITALKPNTSILPTVIVKISANIRNGPSLSAPIIRGADVGEKFSVFGRMNGWVQIGTDKPDGWIAASLVTE